MITDHYLIHEHTMALIPAKSIEYDTVVIEQNRKIHVRQTPLEIIKAACYNEWYTYDGRRRAVSHHTNFQKKIPIPINARKGIFFFPTYSPLRFDNIWLSYRHISRTIVISQKPAKSKIIFCNGIELTMNVSVHILMRQMERTFECMWRMGEGVGSILD